VRQTSFYYSFLALPAPKRKAIIAVFDFCRAVDDAVDLEPDRGKAARALDGWRAEIDRVFTKGTPETAPGRALQPFVGPHRLPRAEFEALVDGVEMDVTPRRYATFAELEPYCHRVASAVGLICAEIFEYRDQTVRDYARDLGVALQLTNILRDVGVDYRVGRLYLPLDELAKFGCAEADIAREVAEAGHGVRSPQVQALLDFQAVRAQAYFEKATRALPQVDARAFLAAEIMRTIYHALLGRIVAARCDVFTAVIRVPKPTQAALAVSTWWRLR
jgi:phytoene synthase